MWIIFWIVLELIFFIPIIVVTSHELLPRFKKMLNNLPQIKTIIYMEDQLQKTSTSDFKPDVNIIGFRNVVASVSFPKYFHSKVFLSKSIYSLQSEMNFPPRKLLHEKWCWQTYILKQDELFEWMFCLFWIRVIWFYSLIMAYGFGAKRPIGLGDEWVISQRLPWLQD